MGWPQYAVIAIMTINVVANIILHGCERDPWDAGHGISSAVIVALLLGAGGFWA